MRVEEEADCDDSSNDGSKNPELQNKMDFKYFRKISKGSQPEHFELP